VANILRAYGYSADATEDTVARRIKLTTSIAEGHVATGTVEAQVRKALAAYKIPTEQFAAHEPHQAVAALRGFLAEGLVVILCVDNASHWVLAIGTLGPDRFVVADPADPELVVVVGARALAERWKEAVSPPMYYALVAHPRSRRKPR
jgi:hypothetical protein